MKFSCEKSLFQAAVNTASRAAAGKSPISALEGLLIEVGTDVKITGYDLKKGIYTSFEADVTNPGAVVIAARLLSEIVRSLPDETVYVSVSEDNTALIVCGESEFSILGSPAKDYPEIQSDIGEFQFQIAETKLKSMINQTIFAVSTNTSRPVYTGSLFEISNDNLKIISVDGYRLAMRREDMLFADIGEQSFIVPASALSDVEKLCSDSDNEITVVVGVKQISFYFGDTVLVSRRLDGEFLNYKKSIPESFNINAVIDKSDFQRVVERVSLIIDDRIKSPLRCIFTDEGIEFICETTIGRAVDRIPLRHDGENIEIGFNNRYLLDAIKAAPAKKLRICLGTSISPCVIKPEDEHDESFLYMILPVRLKAGN